MKKEVVVPSMGESITEATISEILAPNGSHVSTDQELIELETDKVNQVLYAPASGILTLSAAKGEKVKIGQVIGTIEEGMSLLPSSKKEEKKAPQIAEKKENKEPPQVAIKKEENLTNSEKSLKYDAEDLLKDLKNSFYSGRPLSSERKETRQAMSRIRKVIAERMVEAKQQMAMLTTFNEIDMTEIASLRERYKETFLKEKGVKLGLMSFFVKAVVSALEAYPTLNVFIDKDEIVRRHYYDIGVAVGTEKGVVVPVLRDCDHLSYAEIEQKLVDFASSAREGSIRVDDLTGGGFTITNGGTYGSLLSTPIVVPSQCGILGMHKIEKRPVVVKDEIVIRPMMYVALSYDHRLIDGKEAVSFLVHVKNVLEDPVRLLLDI